MVRRTTAAAVVSTGAQGLSSLLVLALVARAVPVDAFATFGVALFASPLVGMVVESGTGPVALRELASGRAGMRDVTRWSWHRVKTRVAILLVAAVVAVVAVPFAIVAGPLVAAAGRAIERFCFDALRGASDSSLAYHALTAGHVLAVAVATMLYAMGGLDDATAWPVLALAAVPLLGVTSQVARRARPARVSTWEPADSTPNAITLTRVVQSLTAGSDTWVAAVVLNPTATAALAGTSRLAMVGVVPLQVLNLVTARWVSTEDPVNLEARVRPAVRALTILSLGVTALPLLVGADRLLTVLFGPAFPPAGEVLVATLLAQAINVASGPSGVVLLQSGQERSLLRVQAGSLALRVGLLASGAWLAGLRGLVVALVVASSIQSAWLAFEARRTAGRIVHV